MTLGKKTLFAFLLGFDLVADVLEIMHVNFLNLSTLLSFCTYLLLPGLLISFILRIRKISFWENLLLIVGFSIAFLEFGGLLLNILLPLFGINDPLAKQNLIIGFAIYVFLLFILAWLRTKQFSVQIRFPRRSKGEKVLYVLPVFFPLLATLGAIVLNNGGSNMLTLILFGTIAFYTLLLVLLRDKISSDIFPYAIFFIGVACLFITSLRGWYITGHDIEIEYYVFKMTSRHSLWNMAFFRDPYNACLSITILPTVLANLLSIQGMYVYKVVFQILFAISPVVIFFILKNYAMPVFAFLSAFLFISFPTFLNDMPMLNRQEIGFIFFGLTLYMLLNRPQSQQHVVKDKTLTPKISQIDTLPLATVSAEKTSEVETLPLTAPSSEKVSEVDALSSSDLSLTMRRILFVVFAIGVIVSHYSTNFVLLALIVFIYISAFIISRPFVKKIIASLIAKSRIKPKNTFPNQAFLSIPLILILFGATYVWNFLYTQTSNHATSVIQEVISSVFVASPLSGDMRSSDLVNSIFFAHRPDPEKELQAYLYRVSTSQNRGVGQQNQYYSQSLTDKYPTVPVSQAVLPPTPFGNLLTSLHIPVFTIQSELRLLSAYFMQIFVFIGIVSVLFIKNKQQFDLQFLLLCFGSILLLALITVLPALSVEYGVLRMFQQFLFLLSLPILLGLNAIFSFMKEQKRILFVGIIAIFLFLNLTGFIAHLTGEYYPQLILDNAGLYYEAYYTHGADVSSIVWLSKNDVQHVPVATDLAGANKFLDYGTIKASAKNFPILIPRDAYVYLQVSNDTIVSINHNVFIYSSDKHFLDDNKNLIYSNGRNNIYK